MGEEKDFEGLSASILCGSVDLDQVTSNCW
jgi:hypothetical protein